MKEVLPATTVTETNRDGLFGRIPRRVLEDVREGRYGNTEAVSLVMRSNCVIMPTFLGKYDG